MLLSFFAVLLTACVNDNETDRGSFPIPTSSVKEGEVTISLAVKVPALRGNADEYYFHNEYTISRLEVWLFDARSKHFHAKALATGLTQAESLYDAQYDITYISDRLRLRAGTYDIFVIANYGHSPDSVTDEADFLNMVDSISYREGIEASLPDKGPVMTSRTTSLLALDLVPWINKDYLLNVELERVVAKLEIGVSENTFALTHNGRKYADINITNYKLVNLNRQYYLFQHRDSLSELTGQPEFVLPYHYDDYTDINEQYVVDPLFYTKMPDAAAGEHVGRGYRSWFGSFTTSDFASMPSANNQGYAYVLENTVFKSAQKNGYSPGIVFKAAVSPVFVYLYDASQHTLREEYRPEYWPKAIYLYKYNFYGSIQAINATGNLALDELKTYTDAELMSYGIKQSKFNMGVYETYYTYWIQHRTDPERPMGPMQYGIVRNNFYRIIVTGISGLGNSVIVPDIMRDNYPNSYVDLDINFER